MLTRALRTPAAARCSALAARAAAAPVRNMSKTVEIDMVCRTWTLKVADDETAHEVCMMFDQTLLHARTHTHTQTCVRAPTDFFAANA